jgi:hypothetical protein
VLFAIHEERALLGFAAVTMIFKINSSLLTFSFWFVPIYLILFFDEIQVSEIEYKTYLSLFSSIISSHKLCST